MSRDSLGRFTTKHGGTHEKLYDKWCSMKERCYNENHKSYKNYGGKGITLCDEWKKDYEKFKNWSLENGYSDGLTIDRIDNKGNYEPSNCRYVTTAEQNRNYSRNHNITYNGETHCIKEWSEITGIHCATILFRIKSGKPLDVVFEKMDRRFKNG